MRRPVCVSVDQPGQPVVPEGIDHGRFADIHDGHGLHALFRLASPAQGFDLRLALVKRPLEKFRDPLL